MTARVSKKLKWIGLRLGLSVLLSPFILYTYGALFPSTAYATDSGEEVNDSQTPIESSQDASQEVVQEDASPELTQSSLDELSTAVATAESDIQTVEEELRDTKDLEATKEATPETTEAISNAEAGVASALSDTASASNAIDVAQEAIDDWETAIADSDVADAAEEVAQGEADSAEAALETATANTTTQEAVVADKEEVKDLAQAEYDAAASSASETVTEDFKDENGALVASSSDIVITVGDDPVSTTNQNGVYVSQSYMDGTSLDLRNPSAPVTITPPEEKQVTEIGFDVYAKNGNATATANLYDSSGATSTESFVVQDNVNSSYPNYTHTEVYQSPSGYYISNVVLPVDYDFYIIDKVYYVAEGTPLDPTYQETLDDATANYTQAVAELEILETEEAEAETTFATAVSNLITAIANAIFAQEEEDAAAANVQTTLASASAAVLTAQESVSSASALVATATTVVSESPEAKPEPEQKPKPESKPVYVEPKPVVVVPVSKPVVAEPLSEAPKTDSTVASPQKVDTETKPPKLPEEKVPSIDSTTEEKVEFILTDLEKDGFVDMDEIVELGVALEDLPEETPISVRVDSSGREVVITAKDAVAIEMVSDPQKLAAALVTDPGAVVEALSSVGKDMTEEEREESQDIVVASVIVSNVANLASNAAAAGGVVSYRRKP